MPSGAIPVTVGANLDNIRVYAADANTYSSNPQMALGFGNSGEKMILQFGAHRSGYSLWEVNPPFNPTPEQWGIKQKHWQQDNTTYRRSIAAAWKLPGGQGESASSTYSWTQSNTAYGSAVSLEGVPRNIEVVQCELISSPDSSTTSYDGHFFVKPKYPGDYITFVCQAIKMNGSQPTGTATYGTDENVFGISADSWHALTKIQDTILNGGTNQMKAGVWYGRNLSRVTWSLGAFDSEANIGVMHAIVTLQAPVRRLVSVATAAAISGAIPRRFD